MKSKYKILFLTLYCLCIFCFACRKSTAEGNTNVKQTNSIVLIFNNNININNTYKAKSGLQFTNIEPTILYWDGQYKKEIILDSAKETNGKKIINLQVNNKYVLLRHRYDAYVYNEFLLTKGDTAVVQYTNGRPKLTILNRKHPLMDINYDEYFRAHFNVNSFLPWLVYFKADMFADWSSKKSNQEVMSIRTSSYKESKRLLGSESRFLDSLIKNNLISSYYFDFAKNRNQNLSLLLDLKEAQIPYNKLGDLVKHSNNTKDMPMIYHSQVIESIADIYIIQKLPFINLQDGVNRDYRISYNVLKTSSLFDDKDKAMLLTRELERIGNSFSVNDFRHYFNLYMTDVKDSNLLNNIKDKYRLKLDTILDETKVVLLINTQNERIKLDDIKKRYAGKIIYVDFWASWCGPCREAFPHSVKLRNDLKAKDIVFIYVSIDQNIKSWQKAGEKEHLNQYSESYLFANYQKSNFTKQQNLSSIPRYMIFNKLGKLIYPNAPPVGSDYLKSLLINLSKS